MIAWISSMRAARSSRVTLGKRFTRSKSQGFWPRGDPLPGGELQDLGELRIRPGRARLGHDIGRNGDGEGVSAHGQPAAQGIVPIYRLDLDELHALSDHQHAAKR
jgi:hypothetical protein